MALEPVAASGRGQPSDCTTATRTAGGCWLSGCSPSPCSVGGFSIVFFDDPKTGRSGDFSTGSILIFASFLPALWGIVELGILPGTKGPNLYGADPCNS